MNYDFRSVELKWQKIWEEQSIFKTEINHRLPKYYVLDMFPYPSGAGLHVGHPLGYIASDIVARYKQLKGFNVLHPMGFDAFGLPAEQYAIQTGQHPALTTEENIKRYKSQLKRLGFNYDWNREIRTCEPSYYKWTQWTFIQLFNHWYNKKTAKAEPIENLITYFEQEGNKKISAACSPCTEFSAQEWNKMPEVEKQAVLMNFRLAYLANTMVNWCPELGTVLANDEVSEGLSIRGGHQVIRKTMQQWSLRITAYSDRLLEGLTSLDWSDSLKEQQKNWIGKSFGAVINFPVKNHPDLLMEIFTTRPDTIFGVTYMAFAPEHEAVQEITTEEYRSKVNDYVAYAANRSERERIADTKKISGQFTGAYAIHPFTGVEIPIYVADYVLAGYGSGAVMAVPGHDSRDFQFAKHFNLPIKEVISGGNIQVEAWEVKEGSLVNSDFINSLHPLDAAEKVISRLEADGIGFRKVTYRLRDAIFSRQRYWGEPFPVYYKDNIPYTMTEEQLPLLLPEVDKFLPTEHGEPPLARARNWETPEGYPIETNTMPGFAGSSGYYLRYMDPSNTEQYFSPQTVEYWRKVDLYIGGAEHATGHLLYARFWNKFLFDIGLSVEDEPFQKLVNQGMILGRSNIVYRSKKNSKIFISKGLIQNEEVIPIHVDVSLVTNDILDIEKFKAWRPDFADAEFQLEHGKYFCGVEIEKMSKSLYNVVNPDELIEKYGADTLRMYEMFLGPLEQSKPWDTKGIEGVFRFIKKFWKLFFDEDGNFLVQDIQPTQHELKILHKTILKAEEDIERLSLNTVVSALMICVNELTEIKCRSKQILENLLIVISPFAPHFAEELWQILGNQHSITTSKFPEFNKEFITENMFTCPVSFNGKTRFTLEIPIDKSIDEIQKLVLSSDESQKWLEGKQPKKIIVIPRKIVNIVI